MSAPTPAPGDDRPREGYYPDPSIPGYVRYWNGAAWVPGTSRPAPSDGEPLSPPGAPAAVEETGPHFFDEDPEPAAPAEGRRPTPAEAQHGSRPEPASAWGADRSRQSGFGGDKNRRVSWGASRGTDPRVAADQSAGPGGDSARTASTDDAATIPPADSDSDRPEGTVVFRRPATGANPPAGEGQGAPFGAPATSAQAAARQALGLNPHAPHTPPTARTAPEALSGPQQGPQQPQQ
ncbi:DUF2510 domain-containing protein, partial [Streptomyces phyllanthi]